MKSHTIRIVFEGIILHPKSQFDAFFIGQFPLKYTKTVKMYTFFCGLKC